MQQVIDAPSPDYRQAKRARATQAVTVASRRSSIRDLRARISEKTRDGRDTSTLERALDREEQALASEEAALERACDEYRVAHVHLLSQPATYQMYEEQVAKQERFATVTGDEQELDLLRDMQATLRLISGLIEQRAAAGRCQGVTDAGLLAAADRLGAAGAYQDESGEILPLAYEAGYLTGPGGLRGRIPFHYYPGAPFGTGRMVLGSGVKTVQKVSPGTHSGYSDAYSEIAGA